MTFAQQTPNQRWWTGAEYDRAVEAGLFVDQRLELIDGLIFKKSSMDAPHAQAICLINVALGPAYPSDRFTISIQCPLRLGSKSRPEPDIAVVTGNARQNALHPTSALLIVEVADATLPYDRKVKRKLYASNGIAEYWIVNLSARCVEVHRNPISDPNDPSYAEIRAFGVSDSISPLSAPDAKILVSDLLP